MTIFKARYAISAEDAAALEGGTVVSEVLSSTAVPTFVLAFSLGARLSFAS